METYYELNISNKLLLLSIIIERWEMQGYKTKKEYLYPSDFKFLNPLETSRIFYLESFYIKNKKIPYIKHSIESSIQLKKELLDLLNKYDKLSVNEKLFFLMNEFQNFYIKKEYKKITIFKNRIIKNDFKEIYNNIYSYLNNK